MIGKRDYRKTHRESVADRQMQAKARERQIEERESEYF